MVTVALAFLAVPGLRKASIVTVLVLSCVLISKGGSDWATVQQGTVGSKYVKGIEELE